MKVLQINTTVNTGSTGKIAEAIGNQLQNAGHESYIAYGRNERPSNNKLIKIGSKKDIYLHGLKTLLTDRHGFGSRGATLRLIEQIKQIKPDIIGMHNLHGYYLNIEVLSSFLASYQKPVVWTLHDCWAFTGHCTFYDSAGCTKWKTACHHCPKKSFYPKSIGLDNSSRNYQEKSRLFNSIPSLHLVTPSKWLANQLDESFLSKLPVSIIHNGIDLKSFSTNYDSNLLNSYNINNTDTLLLGVASVWDARKGLNDFIKLSKLCGDSYKIALVGLTEDQIKQLPANIIGLRRTESLEELNALYARADVFLNPTYQDNFPTTNIEALACGTPVITYDTGGSPEAIDQQTGKVVKKGDINGLKTAVEELMSRDQQKLKEGCRKRAEAYFDQNDRYQEYIELYEAAIGY